MYPLVVRASGRFVGSAAVRAKIKPAGGNRLVIPIKVTAVIDYGLKVVPFGVITRWLFCHRLCYPTAPCLTESDGVCSTV